MDNEFRGEGEQERRALPLRGQRKKSVSKRIVSFLRKGSLHFSLSPSPISYSLPLNALKRKKSVRKPRIPVITPAEIILPQSSFLLATRNPQNINPIQREALPMITQKIAEAKAMGRNDLVLWWSMIEYGVRDPRKARRTLKEVLDTLSGY